MHELATSVFNLQSILLEAGNCSQFGLKVYNEQNYNIALISLSLNHYPLIYKTIFFFFELLNKLSHPPSKKRKKEKKEKIEPPYKQT